MPIIGDDIKSQVGATIVHRTLARLFHERGVKMLRTSQLNVGGNMDFYNMLERERLESKKISKTQAVTSIMGHELPEDDVYIGPRTTCRGSPTASGRTSALEGQAFGDVPLNLEMKLEVWDSPNSAGIVIDAVRLCKLAPEPRHRRPARRPQLVPDEVAEEPAARRRRAPGHRDVHRASTRGKARAEAKPKGRTAEEGRGEEAGASARPRRLASTPEVGDGRHAAGRRRPAPSPMLAAWPTASRSRR